MKQNSQRKKLTKHKKVLVTAGVVRPHYLIHKVRNVNGKMTMMNPGGNCLNLNRRHKKLKKIGGIRLNPNHQRKNQLLGALK